MKRTRSKAGFADEKGPRDASRLLFRLSIGGSTGRSHFAYLFRHLSAAEAFIPTVPRVVSIELVAKARMSELHERFLNLPGPTDVLTFEIDHDSRGRVTEGEVIVCVPEARRQARQRGSTLQEELLLYALHGMLHLSGFDDKTALGYRKMHRKEDEILTRLGVGPVFADVPPHRDPISEAR